METPYSSTEDNPIVDTKEVQLITNLQKAQEQKSAVKALDVLSNSNHTSEEIRNEAGKRLRIYKRPPKYTPFSHH